MALKRNERATLYSRPWSIRKNFEFPVIPKTSEQKDFLLSSLRAHFLLSEWEDADLLVLIDAMEKLPAPAGTKVVIQGEVDDYFYVLQSGRMDMFCERAQNSVGKIETGQIFGEMALFYGCKKPTSFISDSDSTLWRIEHFLFRQIMAQHAHNQDRNVYHTLKKIELFKSLSEQTLSKIASCMTRVTFEAGTQIVKKGDKGEVFYIIEDGSVRVHDIGAGDSKSVDQTLTTGSWFGERALLTGETRAASVTALSPLITLVMGRDTFEESIGEFHLMVEHQEKVQCLKALSIFACGSVTDEEIDRLAELTYEICYLKGQKLAEAGKPYESKIWIIRHGKLLVYGGKTDIIYNLRNGDHFGDKSIFADSSHLSSHDAVCETHMCAWVVEKEAIDSVILDVGRLGRTIQFEKTHDDDKSMKLKDLKRHRILGAGGFGKVWLVESKISKTPYAMKVINKRQLLNSHQEKGVIREKEMLALLQHPFILYLVASFQDETDLYLVLPLIQGGELFNVVQDRAAKGRGYALSHKDAAFYSACIIEALGHFHHRRIAYRDLKLENVMIDQDGYGKIVDLGFAKVVVDKTYTFCGTPEYLAPEIIMSKGHDKAVDYWSYGVLLYELICGRSPFFKQGVKQMDLFKSIVLVHYEFPTLFQSEAKDLVSKLLVRKQSDRIGNLAKGHLDIKLHKFFSEADISFSKLLKKELSAPHRPDVHDPLDASNFDEIDSSLLKETPRGKPLSEVEQKQFAGF